MKYSTPQLIALGHAIQAFQTLGPKPGTLVEFADLGPHFTPNAAYELDE